MIVYGADLHLTPTIYAQLPDMRGDAYFGLRQIVDYCIEHEAEGLWLGGDTFNLRHPDSQSVKVFCDEMGRLNSNCEAAAIQGQHDKSSPPWVTLSPFVTHCHDEVLPVDIDGNEHRLYMLDNMSADWVQDRLSKLKDGECDIIMMHQALRQVISYEGAWNLDEEWIPPFVELVLLGDLHVEASVNKCHYSGSTHIRAMDENPNKSFITVHDENGELVVKRHPLETRMTYAVEIRNEEDLDAAVQGVRLLPKTGELPMRPLALIRVAPDIPDAYRTLTTVCKEHDVFLRMRDITVKTEKTVTAPGEVADSIEKCLDLVVNREENSELHGFLIRLLQASKSGGVSAELDEIKKELGVKT